MYKDNIVDYTKAMSPKEISDVVLLMNQFKRGNITYKQLMEMIKPLGFQIINANTLSTDTMAKNNDSDRLRERIVLDELLPSDIQSYILANMNGTFILFKEDSRLSEIMGANGYQTPTDLLAQSEDSTYESSHM